jgi:hypothetical protein
MTEKLQLRDAVYRLEDTIREIRSRFADDQGRVDEIAFEEGKADPLLALAVPLVLPRRRGHAVRAMVMAEIADHRDGRPQRVGTKRACCRPPTE